MQSRYYDPVIGRFYSNDPVDAVSHLGNAEGIMGFNRYSYAVNNPYKYTDPDGSSVMASGSGQNAFFDHLKTQNLIKSGRTPSQAAALEKKGVSVT